MKIRHRKRFVNNRRVVNPLRIDPTRTTMLRKLFVARLRRQFARLNLAIVDLIVREDALGLRDRRRTIARLMVGNAFCPTGPGGGIDNSCSPSESVGGLSSSSSVSDLRKANGGVGSVHDVEDFHDRVLVPMHNKNDYDSLRKYKKNHPETFERLRTASLFQMYKDHPTAGTFSEFLDKPVTLYRGMFRGKDTGGTAWTTSERVAQAFADYGPKRTFDSDKFPGGSVKTREIKPKDLLFYSNAQGETESVTFNAFCLTANERWRLKTDPDKLKQFQAWLRRQLKLTVLSATDEELWDRYVREGYKRGAGRAFDDVRVAERAKYGAADKLDFYQGSREQFLKSAFGRPESAAKVKLIAERAYDELEGMTADMALKLGRALADGLTKGSNPVEIARELSVKLGLSRNRAEVIARTEIIRAHAEGQLNAMSDLGVEEIGVMVEWSTAGDDRVCDLCAPMEGVVLRIEEAKGMIPRHPNCRCAFIPANVGESTDDQKRGRARVERAVKVSAERAGGDEFDTNVPVSKVRPQSVLNSTWNAFCPTGPGGGVDPTCPSGGGGGSPDIPSPSTLTKVKDLPGSTNPVLMKDESGKLFVVKEGKSKDHLENENAADAIYRAAGVRVKDSAIVDGKKVAEYVADATSLDAYVKLGGDPKPVYEKIGKSFVMDALMANHDVIGMTQDNIMVKNGEVIRIDNGGAMRFRAQGAMKPDKLWGPEVVQLESMRDPNKNPQAAKVFAHLTEHDINEQIKDVVGKREKILDAAKATGVDHKVLSDRLNDLEARLKDGYQFKSKTPHSDAVKAMMVKSPIPLAGKYETGEKLAAALKNEFSKHGYTKLYLEKIAALNPQGIHGGTIVIPHTSIKFTDKSSVVAAKAKQAEVVAMLKEVAPAGTVIKTKGAISAKAAGITKTFGEGAKFEGTFTTTKSTSGAFKASAGHDSQSDPAHADKWAKVESGHVGEASKKMYDEGKHEEWRKTLTPQERVSVSNWKGSAKSIREAVTLGLPDNHGSTMTAKHLMSALEKATPHEGRVYRGVHGEYADGIAKQIIAAGVGGTWSDPAPHCLSLKQSVGAKFAYGKTMFRIHAKTARPIHREDGHEGEEELIGMPKTVYRIAGIHKNVYVKNTGGSNNGMVKHVIDLVEE